MAQHYPDPGERVLVRDVHGRLLEAVAKGRMVRKGHSFLGCYVTFPPDDTGLFWPAEHVLAADRGGA